MTQSLPALHHRGKCWDPLPHKTNHTTKQAAEAQINKGVPSIAHDVN